MEIKIDRNKLLKTISKVQSIIEKKTNMPILSTVLLTAGDSNIHILATDLELGFQQIVVAEVINEGSITISGRKLFEILKETRSSTFHIKEIENNWVSISDDVAKFKFACLPADEYPLFFEPEEVKTVDIDGESLSEMITKTIYSVTKEDAGFKLTGVFTEKMDLEGKTSLRMVATDGHRLSMIDKALPGLESLDLGDGLVIPKKGMSELNKMASEGGTVQIGFKDNNCVARKENAVLMIRLLDSKFPDYHAVIPEKAKYIIELDKILLFEAMRRMLILSNERYRAVKVTLEENNLELISTNPDLGEAQENIKVDYQGERLKIGFNPQYFIDILQSMKSEVISLGFIDNSRPCVIEGKADEGFLGLLMPMRL